MGNLTEFQSMITACHNADVRVYVDVVANHLCSQWDGHQWRDV